MTKMSFKLGASGFVLILLLVSCRLARPTPVSPTEAIRRALIRNSLLESVEADVRVSVLSRGGSLSGSVLATTTLLHGAEEWSASGSLLFQRNTAASHEHLRTAFLLKKTPAQGLVLTVRSLSGFLGDRLTKTLNVSPVGQTFQLVPPGPAAVDRASGGDPEELERLLSLLVIRSAEGPISSRDGGYEYRISTALDPTILAGDVGSASGMLVIDARTFELRRARWELQSVDVAAFGEPIDSAVIDVAFSSFNRAEKTDPSGSGALMVLPEHVLDIIFGKSPLSSGS